MSIDDTPNEWGSDSEERTFEQRLTALEAQNDDLRSENEEIKTQLEAFQRQGEIDMTRRQTLGLLGGGALLGAVGTAGAQSDGSDNAPFAAKDHDHAGDYLGESAPVARMDVDEIHADNVSTTKYADSIAEVNEYIENARSKPRDRDWSGVKIVLRQGELTPSPEDLPIDLTYGVVIEGQGPKTTFINVEGIGKPVFKWVRDEGEGLGKKVALRNLGVLGGGVGPNEAAPGSKAVLFEGVAYFTIENCWFIGLADGIVASRCFAVTIYNTQVDHSNRDGVQATGGFNNTISIINSEIKRSARYNINIRGLNKERYRGAKGIFISGTDVSGAGKYGILASATAGLAIHGCYTEDNGGDSPRGPGLDRDGDGSVEPVQIALSPNASDAPTRGVSISGTTLGHSGGNSNNFAYSVGIKLNNVEGVDITGNYMTRRSNKSLVELGGKMRNVSVKNNYARRDAKTQTVAGPLDGANIPPHELNNGIWSTSDVGGYENIEKLARDHVEKKRKNGFGVVLLQDLVSESRTVNGTNFPPGTVFRGVGTGATTIESTGSKPGDFAVALGRAQKARDLTVRTTGGGVAVGLVGKEAVAESLSIPEAGGIGVRVYQDRCAVRDVICGPDVGSTDIGVVDDATGVRIIGCDAEIDASNDDGLAGDVNTQ